MRDFGDGIQLRVSLCQLTDLDRATLERRLLEVLNQRQDQVLFVKLGPVDGPPTAPPRCEVLGRPLTPGFVRTIIFDHKSSAMPSQNLSTTVAEIDRDHRMIVLALLRRLEALSTDQLTHVLANGRVGDLLELCQELERRPTKKARRRGRRRRRET